MKNLLDIRNLLMKFGTYVYTGDRLNDVLMLMEEIRELHTRQLIMQQDYIQAMLILKQEFTKLQNEQSS